MALFSRKEKSAPPAPAEAAAVEEHAVILHYRMTDDEHGTEQEREVIFDLEGRLEQAIEAADAGEFDGNVFGGGEVVLYMYGPDKERLWRAVEADARACPLRPAYALLRAGGPDTTPEQVLL